MNDPVDAAPSDPADDAVQAVVSAYEHAAAVIGAMDDPDEAFRRATKLWAVLREATDKNGQLRAVLAKRIWVLHKLDLAALADRVSVSKARAGQLLQTARASEQEKQS